MPRASKLTEAQWASLEKRLLAGETASALGRELGLRSPYGSSDAAASVEA